MKFDVNIELYYEIKLSIIDQLQEPFFLKIKYVNEIID